MISRRTLVKTAGVITLAGFGTGGYAVAEPWRLGVTRYAVTPAGWPNGFKLKLAIIADLHVCEPWMPISRVQQIVARTNALGADAVLLLGDFIAGHRLVKKPVPKQEWTAALKDLAAPLGVHAVLGNHDWWEEIEVQRRRAGPTKVRLALEAVGIPVYENDAVRLTKSGQPFWIAGLGDQWAFYSNRSRIRAAHHAGKHAPRFGYEGVDDLPGTLAKVTDTAPVILMIHEPDAFERLPSEVGGHKVALTVAGHTHGGQVTLAGYAPVVPSMFGRRYVYGHIVEESKHLIVSGGLGCSGLPIRFGSPPEIVLVEVGA